MKTGEVNIKSYPEKYWLVTADMGYGHQRAIYPLRDLSVRGEILSANASPVASLKEQRLWNKIRNAYELMSRAGRLPILGRFVSLILDNLLYIPSFYPRRDSSASTLQVRYLKYVIKKGLCSGFLHQTDGTDHPVVTSFYAPAIASDIKGKQPVYCIICDTDLHRVWVSENAASSRIVYFAPGTTAARRLESYGVPEQNILITGFPLPPELLGGRDLKILKENLALRLGNLDPDGSFTNLYRHTVDAYLPEYRDIQSQNPHRSGALTITFVTGGAGAQKEIGKQIVQSIAQEIISGRVRINLVAGTRKELLDYFKAVKEDIVAGSDYLNIIWEENIDLYFRSFNSCLHKTDILWTKPSELSFYCALGLPVILTPAIGPQEKCNRKWLREIGAGLKQQNPEYTSQWLFDLLRKGRLAEAAWNGFIKARKYGTYNITDFLKSGSFNSSNHPLAR